MLTSVILIIVGLISAVVLPFVSNRSNSQVARGLFWTALLGAAGVSLYFGIDAIQSDQKVQNALGEARAARPGSQAAISVTAIAHIQIKDAVSYDPAKHGGGILYQALLHVGSAAGVAKRPGGHLVYCVSEDLKEWHSGDAADRDTSYDLIFRDGGITEQAKSMTVDEVLNQCDTALITPLFLYGKGAKVLGGTVTLTINATKSKTFTIFPQTQQDVWDWIQASY